MIALARSATVKNLVQSHRAGSALARRYVAGPTAEDAIALARTLRTKGILSTAFYLGEYVDRPELVQENVAAKLEVASALGRAGLDTHVSVDPTQIGYQISQVTAEENARRIAEHISRASNNRPGAHCLMLDMEDATVVEDTIAMHDRLRGLGLPAALTLQAYLRRTERDLGAQISRGAHVRLVKGAFAMRGGPAFDTHSAIKENYRLLVRKMLSPEAREVGFYPSIATHDPSIHELALELAQQNGWSKHQFEFEMLFGVRSAAALALAARGARIRLYVPFGRDWWPHAARRIGECPRNGWLLMSSLLQRRTRRRGDVMSLAYKNIGTAR